MSSLSKCITMMGWEEISETGSDQNWARHYALWRQFTRILLTLTGDESASQLSSAYSLSEAATSQYINIKQIRSSILDVYIVVIDFHLPSFQSNKYLSNAESTTQLALACLLHRQAGNPSVYLVISDVEVLPLLLNIKVFVESSQAYII